VVQFSHRDGKKNIHFFLAPNLIERSVNKGRALTELARRSGNHAFSSRNATDLETGLRGGASKALIWEINLRDCPFTVAASDLGPAGPADPD
jgi:hypothetical protein